MLVGADVAVVAVAAVVVVQVVEVAWIVDLVVMAVVVLVMDHLEVEVEEALAVMVTGNAPTLTVETQTSHGARDAIVVISRDLRELVGVIHQVVCVQGVEVVLEAAVAAAEGVVVTTVVAVVEEDSEEAGVVAVTTAVVAAAVAGEVMVVVEVEVVWIVEDVEEVDP